MRAPRRTTRKAPGSAALSARLVPQVRLEADPNGGMSARFGDELLGLGRLSPEVATCALGLRAGLPLGPDGESIGAELERFVRRIASHGLLEYRLRSGSGQDAVVIEPQVADYWPRLPPLSETDVVALSRFAYMRRRGNEMVLESPRAGALFRIGDPTIAARLAALCSPHPVAQLRSVGEGSAEELLIRLLLDCEILFKVDPARPGGPRAAEGDDDLVLWDFHDLLFHARSTEGRHANPLGGRFPFANVLPPLPAIRPPWPGAKVDLREALAGSSGAPQPGTALLQHRHSVRSFDEKKPISLAELSRFLDSTARVKLTWQDRIDPRQGPVVEYTVRPYPCAGSSYELEIYLSVRSCDGLAPGFYHYDAGAHALVAIQASPAQLSSQLDAAEFAMGAAAPPNVLVTIAARFGRVAWKYSSLAYELILKDVGVLTQTFYLVATEMGLGGCAIGSANTDLFAKMTGLAFHVEGAVGQFALGRPESSTTAA